MLFLLCADISNREVAPPPRHLVNFDDLFTFWGYVGDGFDRAAHVLLDYTPGYKKYSQTPQPFDPSRWSELFLENLEEDPNRATEAKLEGVAEGGVEEAAEVRDPSTIVHVEASTSGRET